MADGETLPWLLLTGGTGTGKTTLMRGIAEGLRRLEAQFKRFLASDLPTLFLDNTELCHDQILCGSWCRYLLLDDVGTEPVEIKSFGNSLLPFVRVVEARYDRHLPLIITSNLGPRDFLDRYGMRTYDRMRECCEVVSFEGQSYRANNQTK